MQKICSYTVQHIMHSKYFQSGHENEREGSSVAYGHEKLAYLGFSFYLLYSKGFHTA